MNNQPKVLFVSPRKFTELFCGGTQVTKRNYDMLCDVFGDSNVDVFSFEESAARGKGLIPTIQTWRKVIQGYYFIDNFKQRNFELLTICSTYDYVFIDQSFYGTFARILKKNNYKGIVITFFHDIEYDLVKQFSKFYIPWHSMRLFCIYTNERQACRFSDHVIVLNRRDAELLAHTYKRIPDKIIPVSMKDHYIDTVEKQHIVVDTPPLCIFIGSDHLPNIVGIKWFIEHVYPHVNIRLQIIGKGMSKIEDQVPATIEIYDSVPNLAPFIENADFVISPLFEGGGMKVKICESLMYGKTIFGTNESFEGYDLDFSKVGAVCHTASDFIHEIEKFTKEYKYKFNKISRKSYVEKYSYQSSVELLRKMLQFTN